MKHAIMNIFMYNKYNVNKNVIDLHNDYNHLLYKSSHITIITVCYAVYNKKWDYVITNVSVFITSLLYWKNPTYGLTRTLDIYTVNAVFVYHTYTSIGTLYSKEYYYFTVLGIVSYIISWKLYYNKYHFYSILFHLFLHVFANMGNIALCSG